MAWFGLAQWSDYIVGAPGTRAAADHDRFEVT
jgi:hypothetical protein